LEEEERREHGGCWLPALPAMVTEQRERASRVQGGWERVRGRPKGRLGVLFS
jgi:hypothetical protein